jgi:hypothetical protein
MHDPSTGILARMAAAQESQVYRDLMRFKPEHLTPNAWAVKAGVSRAVWADMRRHGNPSRRTLEKLLAVVGSSLAEFEALRLGDEPGSRATVSGRVGDAGARGWAPSQLPPLPLVRTSLAGEWSEPGSGVDLMEVRSGELIDRLPRPASLAGDPQSYAVTIVGKAMWPRFRPGRRIAVSPRSAVAIGDDVLVRLKSPPAHREEASADFALVAELVRRTNESVELRQFNPDRTFQVDAAAIDSIYKIAGELF